MTATEAVGQRFRRFGVQSKQRDVIAAYERLQEVVVPDAVTALARPWPS